MGSANGCCRNPQVDNTKAMHNNGNQPFPMQSQYGGAWGDVNGYPQGPLGPPQSQNNGTMNQVAVLPPAPHVIRVPGPGDGPVQQLTQNAEVKNGTSKAIGSVLLMFMNSFSQQPRDLLIHLGAGSQIVRPASFVMEDTETLKTATEKKVNITDTKRSPSDANFHVPTVDDAIANADDSTISTMTGTVASSVAPPETTVEPVNPPNYNAGAVSRIINSLHMIPARVSTTKIVEGKKMAAQLGSLQIQKPAPAFAGTAVVNGQFKEISLSDYKGKYVVFFFYPLDFTFVCPTEIIAFSEAADQFRKINCEVIAASTDSHFSHFAWVSTPRKQGGLGEMNIPLLADKTGDIAKAYGVYKEDEGIAFRGLFIIDDKQTLRQITINDLPVGRSVEETLRLVQAFQFTDKHGEVCPAGWKPGDKTIKPNILESKEFFQSS
ncbi:unnamed protein product [Allacma fusca]|uniref:thioredoxin-dependent peroxiredoxin n=1 Tax=Allacma fusca TaxID=39272 RepID=A0A8J2LU76_9HEXA|nr:unnamed protein product [Allacma fusca]